MAPLLDPSYDVTVLLSVQHVVINIEGGFGDEAATSGRSSSFLRCGCSTVAMTVTNRVDDRRNRFQHRWDRIARQLVVSAESSEMRRLAPRQGGYRTAPLLGRTSCDVESMILACASSFSCDSPPGAAAAFRGYRRPLRHAASSRARAFFLPCHFCAESLSRVYAAFPFYRENPVRQIRCTVLFIFSVSSNCQLNLLGFRREIQMNERFFFK